MSGPLASYLVCHGCGTAVPSPGSEHCPCRCQHADRDDDVDHVVVRVLDTSRLRFPRDGHLNPFVRYREFFHSYHTAVAGGISDGDYVAMVEGLDAAIARVDGHGFVVTPFSPQPKLAAKLGLSPAGAVWVKDDTGNVSGSHKARHLMGIAMYIEVIEKLARTPMQARTLAIASCGNAALAAAVVARAAHRPIEVFIPSDANPRVVERLHDLGATIAVCAREGNSAGDPCYLAFRRALASGALPFCVQGSDNGLTIEGGETIVFEMASVLVQAGARLDRLFVQVGGGALASSCVQGVREAVAAGAAIGSPRIHAVQTLGAYPLRRAYERVRSHILARIAGGPQGAPGAAHDAACADFISARKGSPEFHEALRYAQTHRSEFMWPWEEAPHSVAHGILDDETYDWFAVVEGMLVSGGWPVVVSEERLEAANAMGRETTGIRADHTGTSGLAGLLELSKAGVIGAAETCAVMFTGAER
jgi:threonine synthase